MNALRWSSSASTVLLAAAALFSLAPSAFADGSGPRYTETALDSLIPAPADDTLEIEMPLPTRLVLWTEPELGLEFPETSIISLAEFPQGRLSQKPPFIDFSHFEIGGFAGMVAYSSKFKADPSFTGGVNVHVPVPGLPFGEWGLWGEVLVGYVDRDLPFYYQKKSGTWAGAGLGGDYTFVRGEVVYLRAELGVLYIHWRGVNSLDNGIGALVGLQAGFFWIKHYNQAVFTLNPQLSFDGKSWVGLFTLGFQADF